MMPAVIAQAYRPRNREARRVQRADDAELAVDRVRRGQQGA